MGGLRDHLAYYKNEILSADRSHMSVNDMWVNFKSEAIERLPTKMTKTKYSLPWIDRSIRCLIRNSTSFTFVITNQAVLTLSAITNGSEHMFKKSLGMHTENIFPISSLLKIEHSDPDFPRRNEKVKKLWSFAKSLKKDAFGITTLREKMNSDN